MDLGLNRISRSVRCQWLKDTLCLPDGWVPTEPASCVFFRKRFLRGASISLRFDPQRDSVTEFLYVFFFFFLVFPLTYLTSRNTIPYNVDYADGSR